MKRERIGIISLLLVVVLSLGIMAGCGKATDTEEGNTTTATEAADAKSTTAEDTASSPMI